MKKMKAKEICETARRAADRYTASCGGANAERVLKLAYEKVRAKNKLLKVKYEESKK